jgi:hypothetical protein
MEENNAAYNKVKSMKCLVCTSSEVDVAHIKTRGSGGTYDEWNLMPLCRHHHQEQHLQGIITFSQKYIGVASYLYDNGWFIHNCKLMNERNVTGEAIPPDFGVN